MMLSIRWTKPAAKQKSGTLIYWTERIGSEKYAEKINAETNKAIKSIQQNPHIGTKVKGAKEVRRLVVMKDYSLFYRIKKEFIEIIAFWDNRQNPERINI
ncbi:MAG: type II toxin-antitoxin system RelE/ParE family toxin [Proteiniphilum sp.]|jgi:plasmid stabilization system protein ParE|uniref:type II toxin-antitoxin system RelE/ParE family toxin n=1 Tax=Proteiniphilum sp. TaxID=1926877 RepID=UPI002B207817|nr:type II toxin-antitoxin system RelE/ParE family toxin [Proteiniphilum sp.]MEA5129375.1 type II toxin-antitoxin system RelE/ParE family toxin [Proteiniphilum sp.]